MKYRCYNKQLKVTSYEKSNKARDSQLARYLHMLTQLSFPPVVSLRLVRNLSDLSASKKDSRQAGMTNMNWDSGQARMTFP